jgi:ABC-2 type transport system ATP-binding protein
MTGNIRIRAPRVQSLLPRLAAAGFEATLLDGDELLVQGASAAEVGDLAADAGIALHELVQESSTLEKVFLELTGSKP